LKGLEEDLDVRGVASVLHAWVVWLEEVEFGGWYRRVKDAIFSGISKSCTFRDLDISVKFYVITVTENTFVACHGEPYQLLGYHPTHADAYNM